MFYDAAENSLRKVGLLWGPGVGEGAWGGSGKWAVLPLGIGGGALFHVCDSRILF